jgi:starch synthase
MDHLTILFASSEVIPFAKTGGLADVSGSLPTALASLGHKVAVVTPLYRSTKEGKHDLQQDEKSLSVPFKGQQWRTKFCLARLGPEVPIYFIQRDEFFDRSGLYGTPEGDYRDNPERFIFFSRSVIELSRLLGFLPDIVHCHDWQTSLIPVYLKSIYRADPQFKKTRSVFTIHNLAYQGIFPKETMSLSELPPELFGIKGLEYYGKMNFMKGGIVYSDKITTVSERYAHEIQTPEYGYGLEGVLKDRSGDIAGILNGVDYTSWNPQTDPHITANYDSHDLSGKSQCREDLIGVFGLKDVGKSPVIGMISRLADQKGFDILADAMEDLMKMDLRLVILGTGDAKYEKQFAQLGKRYAGRLGVKVDFDNVLAHKIEAGSDMFLMPSKYEPCGLNQMYSLKYGTIPIVRATGGLDDTIREFDPETGKGNGFKFKAYSSAEMIKAIKRARYLYRNNMLWTKLVQNAMKEDFSWGRSARKYEEVYRNTLARVAYD